MESTATASKVTQYSTRSGVGRGYVPVMQTLAQTQSATWLDLGWQWAYRLGFPLARAVWRLRQDRHEGAIVAIYIDRKLLLLRSSYRTAWNFPGGTVRRGETPAAAAQREVGEEIGLPPSALQPAVTVCGRWEGRRDRVHVFELRLDELPDLHLDNREILGAALVEPSELSGMKLTGPVAAYLRTAGVKKANTVDKAQHG